MSKIKSWRWSRLLVASAYKRLVTHPEWIIPLPITVFLLWIAHDASLGLPATIQWLSWFAYILLAASILQSICCADEYYKIWSDKKIIRKIYLYNPGFLSSNKTVKMVIVGKDYEIQEQILAHTYSFHKWDTFSSFLFCIDENHWYYSSPVYEAEPLGRSLNGTIYHQPEHPNRMIILDNSGIVTIEADTFFINGVYIPPLARQNIKDEDTEEKVTLPDKHTQDYLIAKRGKYYSTYSLSHDMHPTCQRLIIPTVIFKAGAQDIILKWVDNYGYKEFYRTKCSVKRNASDVFVELTYQNGIGGTIRKFDEQTGRLDLLYKGYFHGIDFDTGAIIGERGYEYIPETE